MHRSVRIAFLTFFLACASFAQRDLSTLAGTVTDPSGGVVANASIKITEVGTGQVYQLTTNTRGEFVRPALKPSTYVITVSAPGFNRAEQQGCSSYRRRTHRRQAHADGRKHRPDG
jgi:hypothetical protein